MLDLQDYKFPTLSTTSFTYSLQLSQTFNLYPIYIELLTFPQIHPGSLWLFVSPLLFISCLGDINYHLMFNLLTFRLHFKAFCHFLLKISRFLHLIIICDPMVIPNQHFTYIICHCFLLLFLTSISQILVYRLVRIMLNFNSFKGKEIKATSEVFHKATLRDIMYHHLS